MPIQRVNESSNDDTAFFAEYEANIEKAIIYQMCYVGECCIAIGRSTDSYKDRTGNLRNSIGYVVVNNGDVVQQITSSGKGAEESREFMEQLVGDCKGGIYLIVVAGMRYATSVSAKGCDVLDSAELEAEKIMKQLGFVKQ